MITGVHAIIYTTDAEADRAFLREVLGFPHVDAGEGWLIFGLPPTELAVHPAEENDHHQLYLMTDDVEALVAAMTARGIACSPIADRGWGLLTEVTLPGGGRLGAYQPRHARPSPPTVTPKRAVARRPAPHKKPGRGSSRRRTGRGRAGR